MIDEKALEEGYVLSDNYSDSHCFRKQDVRATCYFRGPMCETPLSRAIWVDYLGDYYVLNLECSHFVRLGWSYEVLSYELEEE